MKRLIVLGLLAAVACAPTSHSATQWRQIDDKAEPLEQARPACKSYALKKADTVANQGLAAKTAAGAFAECMRERGWSLVDVE